MRLHELYEEDVIRILDLEDDEIIYVFRFYGNRDEIYRIYDQNFNGGIPGEFSHYTDSYDEVAFVFSSYDDPEWPVIVELNE